MRRRRFLGVLAAIGAAACDVREFARRHGAKQRLSIATGPAGGAFFVIGGGIAKLISAYVPNVEATAEVTSATADNLRFLHAGRADLALAIGPTLRDAYLGTGLFATFGRVPARALATLYTQPMHIVARADGDVRTLADLRGRVVSLGAPGSGTEDVALRMLGIAGVDPARELTRHALGLGPAADALEDGKLDAFFWSSGVPTGRILELATTLRGGIRLIPSGDLLPALRARFGAELFPETTIPRGAYPGIERDVSTVGVSNVLVVDESMSEALAYEITRTLLDHRDELEAIHPAAREFSLALACAPAPVPFHDGALRFYRERGACTP